MTRGKEFIRKRQESKDPYVEHPNGHKRPRPEIEKQQFPVPVETRGGHQRFGHFYPFEDMEVGDSFWIGGHGVRVKHVAESACKFAKKAKGGWKFVCQGQTKGGVRMSGVGVRCWRVK